MSKETKLVFRSSADKIARGLRLDPIDRWQDGKGKYDYHHDTDYVYDVIQQGYVLTKEAQARLNKPALPKTVTPRPDSPFKRERKACVIVRK